MSERYDPQQVEARWRKQWEEAGLFHCEDRSERPKFYCLVMFPYPSGALHVGHGRNYLLGDVVNRYKLMQGMNVLHPMGWDAFGLPAENPALRHNIHPSKYVADNVRTMKQQLNALGIGYDWDREINTSSPDYYKWTQWVFLQLHKRGLAYRADAPINWCPSCQTGLANEEVVDGCCERCGTEVVEKDLTQWFFKITDYADPLLDDLKLLDAWPEHVRRMQANWIGRSEGALVRFKVAHTGEEMPCFTTRPDTLWGVTFMSLAPEHPAIPDLVAGTEYEETVLEFVADAREQPEVARFSDALVKEGVFTGRYVINPVNGEKVPLWVANYALMEYGTGAVMAVPAHDQRDFEFARKYDIPVEVVIQPEGEELTSETMEAAWEGPGLMVNSGPFDGTATPEGIPSVVDYLEENDMGEADVNYRLRDWLISRQRYWGAPIPIVHCPVCGPVPVPEEDLPVLLPEDVDFQPRGKSPLAFVESFVNTTCPKCGHEEAERETDTIAQWLCSCWYFLRYVSPHLDDRPYDRELVDEWLPVDLYIGGVEHAVLHLLYSRFVVKVLNDAGLVSFREPFTALFTQGMISSLSYTCTRCNRIVSDDLNVREPCRCDLGMGIKERIAKGIDVVGSLEKMSKSKGNGVPIDQVIPKVRRRHRPPLHAGHRAAGEGRRVAGQRHRRLLALPEPALGHDRRPTGGLRPRAARGGGRVRPGRRVEGGPPPHARHHQEGDGRHRRELALQHGHRLRHLARQRDGQAAPAGRGTTAARARRSGRSSTSSASRPRAWCGCWRRSCPTSARSCGSGWATSRASSARAGRSSTRRPPAPRRSTCPCRSTAGCATSCRSPAMRTRTPSASA